MLAVQVVFAVTITLALCIWQVARGFEKLDMREGYLSQLRAEPVTASKFSSSTPRYQRIEIYGEFDPNRTFVISNQSDAGRPGFWVFTRFDSSYGQFLVNRGFMPVQGSWLATPDVETPSSQMTIAGVVWPNQPPRSQKEFEDRDWPIRTSRIDIDQMAKLAGTFAAEIRLFADSPGVLKGAPIVVAQESARHWGYAAQWILIGSLIVAGYWYFFLRAHFRRESED